MDSREIVTVSEECGLPMCSDKLSCCCGSTVGSVNAAKDDLVSRTSAVAEERASLGPVTPDINGEFRDLLPCPKSPTEQQSGRLDSARDICCDYESPQTPKEDVFDPFAPGSDDLLLRAPQGKKRFDEWRTSVARRLNFGSSAETPEKRSPEEGSRACISDEEMVEAVYQNLLETILEIRMEDIIAEISGVEWADKDCMTPAYMPKLSGVSETCPGAPVKAAPRSRSVDLSLCRKLEF